MGPLSAFFAEEILVHPFEFDRPVSAHTNIVLDHQFGQPLTVDQDHEQVEWEFKWNC